MRESANNTLYHYINFTFAHESPLLEQVRHKGESLVQGMQISPSEGKTLSMFAKMIGAKHILEIGTFVGYSTLWMAEALAKDGEIITLESNPNNAAIAREHFDASPHAGQIVIKEGKAIASLEALQNEMPIFDLVFIDAAKSEYMQYLELVTPMVRRGGLVIGDNTLLFGNMIDAPLKEVSDAAITAMQSFNHTLGDGVHFDGIMLPTEEGLTIGMKL